MFEQLVPDKGGEGLEKAAKIFYVLAGFAVLAFALHSLLMLSGSRPWSIVRLAYVAFSGLLAFLTARGIEAQRRWAKWLGYAQGVLALFSIPVGTVIGIATLVYLYRADRAGLFESSAAPA